jgi:DNA ligase-1
MGAERQGENKMITRPMLASNVENINELNWPMIATPKVDGIRCLNPDGRILSRSFKPIPNNHIRTTLEKYLPVGADGELFSSSSFQKVTSDVMSRNGKPDFVFWMFDFVSDGNLELSYAERLLAMMKWYQTVSIETKKYVRILPFKILFSAEELKKYEAKVLDEGYEGVCLRTPESPYKCGRATWREKWLLKLKVFLDSEAEVIGFEEQYTNQNDLEINELGLLTRSEKKEGMLPTYRLGKFLCRDIHTGIEFKCGNGQGLTRELREEIWENQDVYIGKIFKYKHQPHGVVEKPRIPIWMGFRDPKDM